MASGGRSGISKSHRQDRLVLFTDEGSQGSLGRRQWWIAAPARGPRQCRRAANHVRYLTGDQKSLRARAGTNASSPCLSVRAGRPRKVSRKKPSLVSLFRWLVWPFISRSAVSLFPQEEEKRVAFQRRPDPCGVPRPQPIVALRRA